MADQPQAQNQVWVDGIMNQFPDAVSRRGLVGMPYNIYLRVARNGWFMFNIPPGRLAGEDKTNCIRFLYTYNLQFI
jgi:hypothetical protein